VGIWPFPNLRLHKGTDGLESTASASARPRSAASGNAGS